MITKWLGLFMILSLCACEGAQHMALLQNNRAVEWDAIIATDHDTDHGGFKRII